MNKRSLAGVFIAVTTGLSLAACGDSKIRDENEQLKAHVLQLQKDAGDLGNRLDVLTKENADLRAQIEQLKKSQPQGDPPNKEVAQNLRNAGTPRRIDALSGLQPKELKDQSDFYNKMLGTWFRKFDANWYKLRSSYDEEFYRMWRYYLASSASAFEQELSAIDKMYLNKTSILCSSEYSGEQRLNHSKSGRNLVTKG